MAASETAMMDRSLDELGPVVALGEGRDLVEYLCEVRLWRRSCGVLLTPGLRLPGDRGAWLGHNPISLNIT